MKPQEAISAIKHNMPTKGTYTILTEGLELAVKALEKQIPMKPIIDSENICPYCGITINEGDEYCFDCGQKIDWSED